MSRTTLSPDSADGLADHSRSGGLRKIGLGSRTFDDRGISLEKRCDRADDVGRGRHKTYLSAAPDGLTRTKPQF